MDRSPVVAYGTPGGRWVLAATVLGTSLAMLDSTVVNVALPAIGDDLGAGVSGLQWTVTGYLLTLSALTLVGGTLGDRFGRRRVFVTGAVWFAVASLACALAPDVGVLVAARAFQGVGGALLTPGSLAIIQAAFAPADRARAIGAWTGLGGVAAAVGPLVGGWLVEAASWRFVFLVNLPVAAVVVLIAARHVPETVDPEAEGDVDVAGAVLATVGLAGVSFALIEGVAVAGVAGAVVLAGFVLLEARRGHPMLPLAVFRSRRFTGANVVTFTVYATLGGVLFLLVLHLQEVLGYSPVEAGLSLLPVTVGMLLLSPRAGALAARVGPRAPMTAGALLVAAGTAGLAAVGPGDGYATAVLPPVVGFAAGLVLLVAPLTATVLAVVEDRQAGLASGVNNAVARAAGLLGVALLPAVGGLSGQGRPDPATFTSGYRTAMLVAAASAAVGAVTAWWTVGRGR